VAAPVLDTRLERYADLAIRVGANVQPGQLVFIGATIDHVPLARALARAAYAAGARYVDVRYTDQHVRRAMIELGPDEALERTPPWLKTRLSAARGNALIGTTGDPEPDLLADLPGVAADYAAAFAADPMFNWFLKPGPQRPRHMLAFFRLILDTTAAPGRRLERPKDGGAAALWLPSEEMTAPGFLAEVRAALLFLAASGLERLPRVTQVRKAMDAHHPHDRAHDYLYFLGVRPDLQGSGLGGRLLKAHTARLDAAGRPAFLETPNPRTVPLYRAHGFEVIQEYQPAPGSPMMWPMWREPR